MLRLKMLKTYTKSIRKNARTGATEVEALDVNKTNPMQEIRIPGNGYILKPNEVYVVQVDNPGSSSYLEDNFVTDLVTLGISCRIVDDDCLLTVQRPVRVYQDMGIFYEDE